MTFEELLKVENLNQYEENQRIDIIGNLFDFSFDNKSISGLEHGFRLIEQIDISKLSEKNQTILSYDIANGWSYLIKLRYDQSINIWSFDLEELSNEIYYLRKAIQSTGFNLIEKSRQCQIYTNLGNAFSFTGRFVEAISYWNKAIQVIPKFSMAIANKGLGLYNYGQRLTDNSHKYVFLIKASEYLKESLTLKQYLQGESELEIQHMLNHIEHRFNLKDLELTLNEISLGDNSELKNYRVWCLENQLYINPINDLGPYTIASRDVLNLTNLVIPVNKPPTYISLFNQIKQEFSSARFAYYQSTKNNETHISDIDVVLSDTLEGISYSHYVEQIKISYRISYSIFDKIAYLLNDYLSLGISERQVNFRSVWKKAGSKELNDKFTNSKNWALRGLFWLSKDIFEKDEEYEKVLEPEAKEISVIRNYIEHKHLKVFEDKSFYEQIFDLSDDISYLIERTELENKCFALLKLARSSIIYLALSIDYEERRKDYSKEKIAPIKMNPVDNCQKK